MENLPTILVIGLEGDNINILASFLEMAFNFHFLKKNESLDSIPSMESVSVILINLDNPMFKSLSLLTEFNKHEIFQNVPKLGFTHRKFATEMKPEIKMQCDDIILVPYNCEDLMQRIDVWIKTFEVINGNGMPVAGYCQMN
jgi:PleD family two-component response regulator